MLMGELMTAVEEGDFSRGVAFCKEAAPRVQEQVATDHRVELGRTSFKIRNPANRPRDWAKPFVDGWVAEDVVLAKGSGELAYLSPIMLAEFCTECHGTADRISDDVKKILAEEYPEDEATGFQAGDLRGWFWVERKRR